MYLTLSRRKFGSSSCSQTSRPWEKKCSPVCVGMTWRRLITAGTMREWRPRIEELNLEAKHYGVGVSGGVEHVVLRARIHHEAGNRLTQTDASNAFNSVLRKPMLE